MIQFSGRRHTRTGILSAVIGTIVAIGFVATSLVSGYYGGEAGIVIGIVGLLLFLVSVVGFILSIKALKQVDVYYRFPMIGLITNSIMMLTLMTIYVLGTR